MSIRDTILALKPKVESVHVPEWNVDLKLKAWTAKERVVFSQWVDQNKENTLLMFTRLIILSVIDDDNQFIFTEADADEIQSKDFDSVFFLAQAIMKLNGMEAKETNPLPQTAN